MSTARIQVSTTSLQVSTNRLGFPGGSVAKNMPASAEDAKDAGSIPGSGRSLGVGNAYSLQYPCLEIPWTEEPGGLQSMGSQRAGHD